MRTLELSSIPTFVCDCFIRHGYQLAQDSSSHLYDYFHKFISLGCFLDCLLLSFLGVTLSGLLFMYKCPESAFICNRVAVVLLVKF